MQLYRVCSDCQRPTASMRRTAGRQAHAELSLLRGLQKHTHTHTSNASGVADRACGRGGAQGLGFVWPTPMGIGRTKANTWVCRFLADKPTKDPKALM